MLFLTVTFRHALIFRTIESLYEELVREGILIRYPKVQLHEYVGEYSYLGTTLRQANIEPMPSLSDVRRVVTEFCILPLGESLGRFNSNLIEHFPIAVANIFVCFATKNAWYTCVKIHNGYRKWKMVYKQKKSKQDSGKVIIRNRELINYHDFKNCIYFRS